MSLQKKTDFKIHGERETERALSSMVWDTNEEEEEEGRKKKKDMDANEALYINIKEK